MRIGVVAKLWRYPVKSMAGEQSDGMEVQLRGMSGDRLFAIRSADGKLGSGKNTRRFCQIDGLFAFSASCSSDWPNISFPDGRCMRGDDPEIHASLSDVLGVAVTLVREQHVSHFDKGAVHLVSTGAFAWLRSRLPQSLADERRFRPNIVVATAGEEQAELSWVDKVIRIGQGVRIKITAPTERCRMITLGQSDLPDDPRILKCIAQDSDLEFGVYGEVLTPGRICAGEVVTIESAA